jgi:flagellar biosynthesis protein FlhA
MITTLKKTHPALVDELVPSRISLALLHRVLQRLLRERVSIRDLVTILEAMGDGLEITKDVEALTEMVRRALANTIGRQYADPTGQVRAITLGSRLEIALMSLFGPRTGHPTATPLTQDLLTHLLRDLTEMTARFAHDGRPTPLVTSPALRLGVRKMLEPVLPHVPVLALAELPTSLTLASVATWEIPSQPVATRSDALMVG